MQSCITLFLLVMLVQHQNENNHHGYRYLCLWMTRIFQSQNSVLNVNINSQCLNTPFVSKMRTIVNFVDTKIQVSSKITLQIFSNTTQLHSHMKSIIFFLNCWIVKRIWIRVYCRSAKVTKWFHAVCNRYISFEFLLKQFLCEATLGVIYLLYLFWTH